jgi:hypothetical protein
VDALLPNLTPALSDRQTGLPRAAFEPTTAGGAAPMLWESPQASVHLELDTPQCGFVEITSDRTRAGDDAAEQLVGAALAQARSLHLSQVRMALDASRPICGVVLTGLQHRPDVLAIDCRRCGISVMVTVDLASEQRATPRRRGAGGGATVPGPRRTGAGVA